jgi:hypothetical protein
MKAKAAISEAQVSETHKHSSRLSGLAWMLAMVLFYLVSVGPAARLAAWSGSVNVWLCFMKVYEPVMLIRNTPLCGSFDWWVDLWVEDLVPFNLSGVNLQTTSPAHALHGGIPSLLRAAGAWPAAPYHERSA